MPADLATLKTRLAEAESAYHDWVTGKNIGSVNVDGHQVDYNAFGLQKLQAYINQLRAEIARAGGSTADGARRRRALRPFVG
ncbi:MAG: gpW family head-tail joining protein [Rhodospirillaceae bacterium]|nr:gpW family head-tail joining protein [Rhodospirillaceae bacterium]